VGGVVGLWLSALPMASQSTSRPITGPAPCPFPGASAPPSPMVNVALIAAQRKMLSSLSFL